MVVVVVIAVLAVDDDVARIGLALHSAFNTSSRQGIKPRGAAGNSIHLTTQKQPQFALMV